MRKRNPGRGKESYRAEAHIGRPLKGQVIWACPWAEGRDSVRDSVRTGEKEDRKRVADRAQSWRR